MSYKWDNPYEWVAEKAREWERNGTLFQEFLTLAQQVEMDTLQDLYQSDMIADGYFNEDKEGQA